MSDFKSVDDILAERAVADAQAETGGDFEVIREVVVRHEIAEATHIVAMTEIREQETVLLVGALLRLAASESIPTPDERSRQKQSTGLLIGKLGLTNSLRQVLLEVFPIDPVEEGLRLQRTRLSQGLSIRDLSIKSGVPRTYIGNVEEVRPRPNLFLHDKYMAKVGQALGW